MGKKCADTQIAHVIAIHAKTAHLALALMAFLVSLTNGGRSEMKNVEFHNTKDAFGNQLNVGDEVYYFKRHGKNIRFGRGVVTHFTKLKIAVKGEHASVDPGTACDPTCVAKIFAAKEK